MLDPLEGARYRGQFRPEFSRIHRDRDLFWVVPFPVRYVVGVTGERFAGKSAALAYLSEKKGFEVYSLADELRALAVARGVPVDPRSRLQDLGDLVRAEHNDAAHLARLTLRRIHRDHLSHRPTAEPTRRVAVGGFKRPEEVELFEGLGNFKQLEIAAYRTRRFERSRDTGMLARELSHVTPPPALTVTTFREHMDERDLHGNGNQWMRPFGQQVSAVISRPSATKVRNNGLLAELYDTLDRVVAELDHTYRTVAA